MNPTNDGDVFVWGWIHWFSFMCLKDIK
jgi:hypothetical protein